jgi:hypothetical protein
MMPASAHIYDDKFLAYATVSSAYSAAAITRLVTAALPVASVLDVGCAEGVWLDAWRQAGVREVAGVDGTYVQADRLWIAPAEFTAMDLARPFDLGRRFDVVQSLEVAEHVPEAAARDFVASIARHSGGLVLFSAAPPGQGGEHHVNERPYDYWRSLFQEHGFHAHDYLRPLIAGDPKISFWYRHNVFLYVADGMLDQLPEGVRARRVADGARLRDLSPPLFKLRKLAIRCLPHRFQNGLAQLKALAASW